ncbi:uncharacterized protein LOC110720615 isoform X2 [Chenopodium quinoa]|uniref:uncharacterized protein LOC110720615 isoform X2 n=1 Tax=Chenopodium quinoa TaxID=63459 RepID=UPI000B789F1B|nr:uncharacterized protein LOC110720615 isoform X2 [Chenopodium quinoa]
MAASALPIIGCIIPSTPRQPFLTQRSASIQQWHLMGKQHSRQFAHTRGAFRMLADSNASSGKGSFRKEVLMVDPLEAKKLAAKQYVEIRSKEKFERRRQIEAINGAWAMIGLTAGLVIEGHTGKTILGQLDGYWHAILGFFVRW